MPASANICFWAGEVSAQKQRHLSEPLNEESLENEVSDVHLNVPWAQQADKKSLNVGYKKRTFIKIYVVI